MQDQIDQGIASDGTILVAEGAGTLGRLVVARLRATAAGFACSGPAPLRRPRASTK